MPKFYGDRKFQEFKGLFFNVMSDNLSMLPIKKLWYINVSTQCDDAILFRHISLNVEALPMD